MLSHFFPLVRSLISFSIFYSSMQFAQSLYWSNIPLYLTLLVLIWFHHQCSFYPREWPIRELIQLWWLPVPHLSDTYFSQLFNHYMNSKKWTYLLFFNKSDIPELWFHWYVSSIGDIFLASCFLLDLSSGQIPNEKKYLPPYQSAQTRVVSSNSGINH